MKKITKPETTVEVFEELICELCMNSTPDENCWPGTNFSENRNEVKVQLERGSVYPESTILNYLMLDICPRCFMEKLVPWFESQGGKTRNEDLDL